MLSIIKNDEESIDKFHDQGWGREDLAMDAQQLEQFLNGDVIAVFDGEYTHTITLNRDAMNKLQDTPRSKVLQK
ncbi:hypothetical protein ACWNS2_13805 [Planococcus plakortidis]